MDMNDEFIPGSSRIDFQFHFTEQAHSTPEFQTLT